MHVSRQSCRNADADHGVTLVCCEDQSEGLPFAYSVGLGQKCGHPEILMANCSRSVRQRVLHVIASKIEAGEKFDDWTPVHGLLKSGVVWLREIVVGQSGLRGIVAQEADPQARVLHLLFPDPNGRFPWNADCNPEYQRQQEGVVYRSTHLQS